MTALYRLQTVAALTRAELNALAALVAFALIGLGAQAWPTAPSASPAAHVQQQAFAVRSALPVAALADASDAVKADARAAVAAEPPVEMAAVAALLPASATAAAAPASGDALEAPSSERRAAPKPVFTGRMNLNTATSAELQRLPRIGEAMAQRILDYRRANGRFRSVEDLNNVRGIGDKTLEKLRPHLYI